MFKLSVFAAIILAGMSVQEAANAAGASGAADGAGAQRRGGAEDTGIARRRGASSIRPEPIVKRRNGIAIVSDTQNHCETDEPPMRIVVDDLSQLPNAGLVSNTIANGWLSIDCIRNRQFYNVPVYNPAGEKLSDGYFAYRSGAQTFAFPVGYLTPQQEEWLRNDPGLPFARIAAPFVSIISGFFEETNWGYADDTQFKSIYFQFALRDAGMCPEVVGETASYKHTITRTDDYGTDRQETVYKFDKEWEKPMLKILNEGNHIGSRLGSFSATLISHYGCQSAEISRLRGQLHAFGGRWFPE